MGKVSMWFCGVFYALIVWGGGVVNGENVMFFIFGDEVNDVGTNNYIISSKEFQANYYPYGIETSCGSTGRLCDGLLIPDYIAEFANLPFIPPYLEPNANFSYGANFASGGSGALRETNDEEVLSLRTQVGQFILLQEKLRRELGNSKAKKLIAEAVYFISVGINDYKAFVNQYEARTQIYDAKEYVELVTSNLTAEIQVLYDNGAKKFLVALPKDLGCTPGMRQLAEGDCYKLATNITELHNEIMEKILTAQATKLEDFNYIIFNQMGFKYGDIACCGSGPDRRWDTCGGKLNAESYELCINRSAYVYFDAYHVSQGINKQAAIALWEGNDSSVKPLALKEFFNREVSVSHVSHERKRKAKIAAIVEHASS
ncbi:hypothetical protein AMTRI_Chr06g169570 [Amborella trichopoda]